jgi:molybdopterin converting factor small subunit
MSTLLTEIVRKQTASSVINSLGRSIDTLAEELARELLREPEFRAEMQQLIRAAFRQTLKELNEPPGTAEA